MIRLEELEQGIDSSSNNLSVYKHRQADGSSVKMNYLCSWSVIQTNLLAWFVLTDNPSVCINAAQDKLYFLLSILIFNRVLQNNLKECSNPETSTSFYGTFT